MNDRETRLLLAIQFQLLAIVLKTNAWIGAVIATLAVIDWMRNGGHHDSSSGG